MHFRNILLTGVILMFIISCNSDPHRVDVSEIQVDAKIQRFEHDLFKSFKSGTKDEYINLKNEYNEFFDVFVHQILNIPQGPDSIVKSQLEMFVHDAEVNDIYRLTDSAYQDINDLESGMESFLKHLHYYFPAKPVPQVLTYISAFNYAVITTDSTIGIGLDMFLGQNTVYYPRLGIPRYMFNRFQRDYIIPSAIKAWFQSEYDVSLVKNEFMSQMIYQGKLLHFSKAMGPAMNDTLLTGYTASQLDWCKKNEAEIWSFFIENKLLFNTDPSLYAKFINEGPSTSGFPQEAPGKLGAWIGWQIVEAYMTKNNDVTLPQLMMENDAQKILEVSGYKPQK